MKKQGNEITTFGELLSKTIGRQIQVQTHWAEVTEVDWEAKTMTVKGTLDGLEFYDVLLGLGSWTRKPKLGATCLIGSILNKSAASFLIDCNEIEEAVWVSEDSSFTIKQDGFIVKQRDESLKDILNDLVSNINGQNEKIQDLNVELQKVIVVQGTSPNIPALTTLVSELVQIKQSNIEINNRLNTVLIA
ncbi:MAG: hypothetical protein ACPG6B_01395 [Oceanihabitans sp.]